MKKILIITDNDVGKQFLQRTIDTFTKDNIYYVIQTRKSEFKDVPPSRFKFFEFDTTSLYKISNVLKMEFIQVFIALSNPQDVLITIENIRVSKKNLRVVVVDNWRLKIDDSYVVLMNTAEVLTSHMFDYLPNVPVIAQNVGLGEGEVMEVMVPFGSSFVYRHVGVIEQKNWRIAGLYRDGKLILPHRRQMIHPNDTLLLLGEPAVLNSVYRAIKREIGQFPQPFGTNIYLFIDMLKDDTKKLLNLVEQALNTYNRFTNKLFIKICNPSDLNILAQIKENATDHVIIDIDYQARYIEDMIFEDVKHYDIGMIMLSNTLFSKDKMRDILFDVNIPVLSLGSKDIESIKKTVVVLNDNKDLEKISTTVYDFSAQMGFDIELFKDDNETSLIQDEIIEHYQNLAEIFSKSIVLTHHQENPIRKLQQRENFLLCMPFTEMVLESRHNTIFSTDIESLYYRLGEYHQLFIPRKI